MDRLSGGIKYGFYLPIEVLCGCLLRAAVGMLTEMADLSDVMAATLKPWPADDQQAD